MSIEIKDMTLRDWFAGQALIGLVDPEMMTAIKQITDSDQNAAGHTEGEILARLCYEYAGAMLKMRRK